MNRPADQSRPPAADQSLANEDARETPDIHYLHAPILREQAEPRDGREPGIYADRPARMVQLSSSPAGNLPRCPCF